MRTFLVALLLAVPVVAAPDKGKPPPPTDAADIADKLQERVDLDRYEQIGLRALLDVLQDKIGYTILLDYKALLMNTDAGGRQGFDQTPVTLPAIKKVRLETVLRQVLDQFDADFLIEADHIRVTTPGRKDLAIGPRQVLPVLRRGVEPEEDAQVEKNILIRETPTVTLALKDVPLAEAIKTVSARTGRAVAIDPDAGEKAKTPVTLALANAPFETAVAVLAEAAGLRAFRTGNAAVIVTPERAKKIEELPMVPAVGLPSGEPKGQ
jgi:hypothetical protein